MLGRSAAGVIVVVAVLATVAACSAAPATPAWTQAPPSSAPSPQPTSSPAHSPQVTPSTAPSPGSPTASPAVLPPTPSSSAEPGTGLTEAELTTLTGGNASYTTVDPPPPVSRARAEEIVRAAYPGDRPLVASELIAFGEGPRIAWLVVLGTAPGQPCAFHPGLLERALEGGIVDAETGDLFWSMTCG